MYAKAEPHNGGGASRALDPVAGETNSIASLLHLRLALRATTNRHRSLDKSSWHFAFLSTLARTRTGQRPVQANAASGQFGLNSSRPLKERPPITGKKTGGAGAGSVGAGRMESRRVRAGRVGAGRARGVQRVKSEGPEGGGGRFWVRRVEVKGWRPKGWGAQRVGQERGRGGAPKVGPEGWGGGSKSGEPTCRAGFSYFPRKFRFLFSLWAGLLVKLWPEVKTMTLLF